MDQPEEILERLERFNVQKNPEITRELDEYVSFVARTGESVFNWSLVKKLYREKLINVITDFYNETPTKELPQYPNVDPFNYETMKKMLIERLDSFNAAPFTIQRISELLSDPRKQYSRIDKFMRAVEKNILVVSTVSPSRNRSEESENGDSLDSVGLNGDFSTDVNVDIDMENDGFSMTKEFNATTIRKEPNHDIITETQETVTIKKITSNDEASTSTISESVANGDSLHTTQTDVTVETQSTVTITVCEPKEENKPVQEETIEKSEDNVEEIPKVEDTVIKSDVQPNEPITLLTENVEPKIDDALLNEPLRPADDEILPENPETTPLAALENIVANRVEVVVETPRVEETVIPKQDVDEPKAAVETPQIEQPIVQEQVVDEQKEQKSEEIIAEPDNSTVDDSGIEAKRIRIEEVETEPIVTSITEVEIEPQIETESITKEDDTAVPIVEEPLDTLKDVPVEPEIIKEIENNTEIVPVETQIVPIIEEKDTEEDAPITAESVVEPLIKEPEDEQNATIEPIPEQPLASEGKMEEIPVVENTMALDEEIAANAQIPEMEITAQANNNKMETDDNESENVLMDTDETEEPMDQ